MSDCQHLRISYTTEFEQRPVSVGSMSVTTMFWACTECGVKFLPVPSIEHLILSARERGKLEGAQEATLRQEYKADQ